VRWLARALLGLFLAGSLALTALAGLQIWRSDLATPLRERTSTEIVAATDRMMAREATAGRLTALIEERLAEVPRNWVTLKALRAVADARGLALPVPLIAAYDAALAEDTGVLAVAGECAACIWDIAACTLSVALICKAPILLTPVEDLRGITKAGWDYATLGTVDEVDLGLSVLGLGATALVLASGGSSATLKMGASAAKLARGMRLLSPGLERMVLAAVRGGVDWPALARMGEVADLSRAVRLEAFAPLAAVASDIGRMGEAMGPTATLHLLRHVDDAAGARQMARAADALGPQTLARAEVLGPARLMRATLRVSEAAWGLVCGLAGMMTALASMLAGALQGAGLRVLRRLAG
jgi:hypothetical protein